MSKRESSSGLCRNALYVGVDIGAHSAKIGLRGADHIADRSTKRPVVTTGAPAAFLAAIADEIEDLVLSRDCRMSDLRGVGLLICGQLDFEKGEVINCPNIDGWQGFAVIRAMHELLVQRKARRTVRVVMQNDAKGAGIGEFFEGSAADADLVAGFTVGSGIGGFVLRRLQNGDVLIETGVHQHGAELGHVPVFTQFPGAPKPRICGCKQRGCLEAYAGATAIERTVRDALRGGVKTRLRDLWPKTKRQDRVELVDRLAKQGDRFCRKVMDDQAFYLAKGLAAVVAAFDPEVLLLVGGLTRSGPALLKKVSAHLEASTFKALREHLRVRYGELGSDAGWIGGTYVAQYGNNGTLSQAMRR